MPRLHLQRARPRHMDTRTGNRERGTPDADVSGVLGAISFFSSSSTNHYSKMMNHTDKGTRDGRRLLGRKYFIFLCIFSFYHY